MGPVDPDPDSNPDPQHCLRHHVRVCACCMLVLFPDIKRKLIDELESSNIPGKQCCGSGMFIPDPNFSKPDLGSRVKRSRIPDSDPRQRIYVFLSFNPKNFF